MEGATLPLFSLHFDRADRAAADSVLESGWVTSGAKVSEFERAFGVSLGAENVVAVSSGTAALHLAMTLYGIGPGDEVIVPALTFVAAANMVLALGATPVFADIVSLDEPNLDPASVARLVTPKTKAVVPVHYAGYPCRLEELGDVLDGSGTVVIEDSAHACITRTDSGACGTLCDAGAFSFFSNKNLAIGEGGALVVPDGELAERARLLRSHGMSHQTLDRHRGHAHSYDVRELGFNYRWDELRAAVGLERLARLPSELERRRELGRAYRRQLSDAEIPVLVPFGTMPDSVPPHIFPVLLPEGAERSSVMDGMRAGGVQTSIHYPLTPEFEAYRADADGEWETAATYCLRVLTLPFFPDMTEDDVSRVVTELDRCLR